MSSSRINLKSSLTAINLKQTGRKQKKQGPRYKAVLAHPCKQKLDKLSVGEAREFADLLQADIKRSAFPGRCYARVNRFSLGLESCLRAINNKEASCVLISLSIKPRFIIYQIGYFSRERNRKVPVYTVQNLEAHMERLFGVKALVLALPMKVPLGLSDWVKERIKLNKDSLKNLAYNAARLKEAQSRIDLRELYLERPKTPRRAYVPKTVRRQHKAVETQPAPESDKIKEWLGDYIALSKVAGDDMKKENFQKDRERMFAALRRMASNIEGEETIFQREIQKLSQARANHSVMPHPTPRPRIKDNIDWSTISPYLRTYKPLEMHKIQPNSASKARKTCRLLKKRTKTAIKRNV